MSGKQQSGKKRKKQYYIQAAKKGKWSRWLDADMKGFLITCNNREREAVREAYNLFNEYADKLYGPEKKPQKEEAKGGSDDDGDGDDDDDDDIEAALEKEVSELKSVQKHERRFQQVESGANNCIFIKTSLPDPTELVSTIFNDIYESETAKSRYIMRLLPIIGTCRCSEEKIKKLAEEALKKYFTDAIGHTFSVNIKVRNNNRFGRKQVLPLFVDVVKELNPANHPNLDDPEYIVNVDILRNVLCLSVLKESVKFRKYNLQEVVTAKSRPKVSSEKSKAADKSSTEAAEKEDEKEKQLKGELTDTKQNVEKGKENDNDDDAKEIMNNTKDKEESSEPETVTEDAFKAADNSDKAADNSGRAADNSNKGADDSGRAADNSDKGADDSGEITGDKIVPAEHPSGYKGEDENEKPNV